MAKQHAATNGKVFRFTKAERASHWVHTICFFLLLFTGLAVFAPGTSWIASLFGGISTARVIHRAVAIPYALFALLILFVGAPRQGREWLKVIFTWKKDDLKFMAKYVPTEFMGRHGDLPESDKFNAGEKMNSILTLFTGLGLVASGLVMTFPQVFPAGLVRIAYPIHDLSWLGMTAMLLIHIFLSVFHPKMRAALQGMIGGWVPEDFAKSHYPKWYREVTKK